MNLYIILSTVNCDTVFRVYTLGKLKMHRGLLQFKLGLFILVVVLFCLLFYMYQIILRVVNGNTNTWLAGICNLAMCSCEYLYNTIKRIIRIMYIYTIIHTKRRVIYIYIYLHINIKKCRRRSQNLHHFNNIRHIIYVKDIYGNLHEDFLVENGVNVSFV